jgi:uridine kinase
VVTQLIDFDAAVELVRNRPNARLIAIDGLPVSGKSTLATRLETELGLEGIFLDDFVRPESEWRGRVAPAFPFEYIRYDEFMAGVRSLARGEAARYQLYDWSTGSLGEYHVVAAGKPVVIEGVSVLHQELSPLYDLRFWVESDASATLTASLARGVGGWEHEWRDLFMPSVELYLRTNPRSRADCLVAGRGVSAG